jgi:hypothetical protein
MQLALSTLAAMLLASSALANPCSAEFTKFLSNFENSESFRASHTLFPLKFSHVDHDAPDMKTKHLLLNRQNAKRYESFPSPRRQSELRLQRSFKQFGQNQCDVTLAVPDSDMYAISFSFVRLSGTWKLAEIIDSSL